MAHFKYRPQELIGTLGAGERRKRKTRKRKSNSWIIEEGTERRYKHRLWTTPHTNPNVQWRHKHTLCCHWAPAEVQQRPLFWGGAQQTSTRAAAAAGRQEAGERGSEKRKRRRENRRSHGSHFSLCQLLTPPVLPPSCITPWDVDASRGQLPTDTSSWAARQALTALVQTNDTGVEVAGLPSSQAACSRCARPCAALVRLPLRTHTQKKQH